MTPQSSSQQLMPTADKPPTKELTQLDIKFVSPPDVKKHAKPNMVSPIPIASKLADTNLEMSTLLSQLPSQRTPKSEISFE
jgi:hypothetical protein